MSGSAGADPGHLVVTYGNLEKTAGDIETFAKHLRQEFDDIATDVRHLCESWEGEAQHAYTVAMKSWDKEVSDLHINLLQIAEAVRRGKDGYQATDLKSARWFEDHGKV